MNKLHLILVVALVALVSNLSIVNADSYDSDTATIQKSSDTVAKVVVDDKTTYSAPISFTDGATWDAVKDHYELDPAVVSGLAKKKVAISIGSDGTATFSFKK